MRFDLTAPNSKVDSFQSWRSRLLAWLGISISTGAIVTLFAQFTGGSTWSWRFFTLWVIISTGAGYWGSTRRRRKGPKPPPEVTRYTKSSR